MTNRKIFAVVMLGIVTTAAGVWAIAHSPEKDIPDVRQPEVNQDVTQIKVRLRSSDIDTVQIIAFSTPLDISLEDCPNSTSLQRCLYRLPKEGGKVEVFRFPDEAFVSIVYIVRIPYQVR